MRDCVSVCVRERECVFADLQNSIKFSSAGNLQTFKGELQVDLITLNIIGDVILRI